MMPILDAVNAVLWHDGVLYTLLGVGVLFTLWTRLGQYRALTHGVSVIRGRYDRRDDPGAISHFQALSAALSATVGLGNIAGVAIAVSLGGPGAVFWMWVTGFIGMSLKMTEVTQAMLYRDLNDPRNPRGGAMWVASRGLARFDPALASLGRVIGGIFCVTLLVSTFTGGNMFQAWNATDISREYFGVPAWITGGLLTLTVGAVILGGIRRIGTVAGQLVPFMCLLYLAGGLWVLVARLDAVPGLLRSIVVHAFTPTEAQGAFVGATFGWVFLLGMRRALFSNEAGQGSAPIAHSAARTEEPVREGIVAGLEPFIDTLVVCTITALVILSSGVWDRPPDLPFAEGRPPQAIPVRDASGTALDGVWTLGPSRVMPSDGVLLRDGTQVYAVVTSDFDTTRANHRHRLEGHVGAMGDGFEIHWSQWRGSVAPQVVEAGLYVEYKGATLTARAFDRVVPGLGRLIVPAAVWLFALSTMISWSYYGEQGSVYLFGTRSILPYRAVYCLAILVAASPLVRTESELDALSSLGTGVMLFANIPIMLVFGRQAMRAYHDYVERLDDGAFESVPREEAVRVTE